jgi:hypothetical protein
MLTPPHGMLSADTASVQRDVYVQHAPAMGHAKASVFTCNKNCKQLELP